jgi:hypothetical protein
MCTEETVAERSTVRRPVRAYEHRRGKATSLGQDTQPTSGCGVTTFQPVWHISWQLASSAPACIAGNDDRHLWSRHAHVWLQCTRPCQGAVASCGFLTVRYHVPRPITGARRSLDRMLSLAGQELGGSWAWSVGQGRKRHRRVRIHRCVTYDDRVWLVLPYLDISILATSSIEKSE